MPNAPRYSLTHRLATGKVGTLLALCERQLDDEVTDFSLLQDLARRALRRGVGAATAIERVWVVHPVAKLPDIHFGGTEVLHRGERPGGNVSASGDAFPGKSNAKVFRARAREHPLSGWVPLSGG